MESPLVGLMFASGVIIAAERKRQTVEDLLVTVGQAFDQVEAAISAVTRAQKSGAPLPIVLHSKSALVQQVFLGLVFGAAIAVLGHILVSPVGEDRSPARHTDKGMPALCAIMQA